MTQVNLLPAEVRNKQRVRRITAAAIGAVGAVLVLLLVVYLLQSARLGDANSQLAAQNSLNAGLRGKVASLQHFQQLNDDVIAKQQLVGSLMAQQILWSDALRQISASTPDGVWFTSVTGLVNETPDGQIVGNVQFQGKALNHLKVAQWLTSVEKVDGWVNSWVSSSALETDATGKSSVVTFAGSVDLSLGATSNGRPR